MHRGGSSSGTRRPKKRTPLFGHTDVVSDLQLLDDDRFVSGSYDGTVLLWDLAQSEPQELAVHQSRVLSVEALLDGRFVSTDEDGTVLVTQAGVISDSIGDHTGPVVSSLALPGGRLVTGSEDGTIRLWDPLTDLQSTLIDKSRAYGSDGTEQAFQPYCAVGLEAFNHMGFLGVGEFYSRFDTDRLADGTEGRFYAVGKTGNLSSALNVDPFEFVYKSNNIDLSEAFVIRLAYNPDLKVTDITMPDRAEEGAIVDISWTVANIGSATADGMWYERVYLQESGNPQAPLVQIASYRHTYPLEAGKTYTRHEAITIPGHPSELCNLIVKVNTDERVYEGGRLENNTLVDEGTLVISILPRADLRVMMIDAPDEASPTDSLTVAYQIGNFGGAATWKTISAPTWIDSVYLSLDTKITTDDIFLGSQEHPAALDVNEIGPVLTINTDKTIPLRYRGTVYVLVATDTTDVVSEWPNNANNVAYYPIFIEPEPLPDLVVHDVTTWQESVELADATEHAIVEVQYKVTNRGLGEAITDEWVETVWLTNTPERPHSNRGDFKLEIIDEVDADGNVIKTFKSGTRQIADAGPGLDADGDGLMDRDAGYTRRLHVRLPDLLESGVYYIMPWVDPYDQLKEDSLAINVNPYDPNQIDSSNYFGVPITTIAARPDLLVKSIEVTGTRPGPHGTVIEIDNGDPLLGGDTISVTWTVENHGNSEARPGGWTDSIYLSPVPNPTDSQLKKSLLLGTVRCSEEGLDAYAPDLNPDDYTFSYTRTLETTLAPSAVGEYIVVKTNTTPRAQQYGFTDLFLDGVFDMLGKVCGPGTLEAVMADYGIQDPRRKDVNTVHLEELTEVNNIASIEQIVDPAMANLRVVSSEVLTDEVYSGGEVTFRYTVLNDSDFPVWTGTEYWKDHIWISYDDTWPTSIGDVGRQTYLGAAVTSHAPYIGAHQEYTVEFTTLLPEGLDGDYYFWVHLDAHRNYSTLFPPVVDTGWLPKNTGSNEGLKDYFRVWAYEDPFDNISSTPVEVIYREADLVVANVQHADSIASGGVLQVDYRVENQGLRDTRQSLWYDRIFLSRDGSLDEHDLMVWQQKHSGTLASGDSYTNTAYVSLPESVDGDYHLVFYTDSVAHRASALSGIMSNIGYGERGVQFARQGTVKFHDDEHWDNVSIRRRNLAKGEIAEYDYEWNNMVGAPLTIETWIPTDLVVGEVVIPEHVAYGEKLEVTYTVVNQGGDTTPGDSSWNDQVYLSRDQYLDTRADRFIGEFKHSGGLSAGSSYSRRVNVRIPTDMLGAWYVFVVADPRGSTSRGSVIEGDNEQNNSMSSPEQVVIDVPPPTDLEVIEVDAPLHGPDGPTDTLFAGDAYTVTWTVSNIGGLKTSGFWSDAIYLSADEVWDVNDRLLDVVSHTGALMPGEAYTGSLATTLPPVLDGNYRVIVRTDIYNQVWEDEYTANNSTTSDDAIWVEVPELPLDGFLRTTIKSGQERLYRISGVGDNETMQVALAAAKANAACELFVRHEAAPTGYSDDEFAYRGGVTNQQEVVVPLTEPGAYYVLVRGFSIPGGSTSLELSAEYLPLAITDVHTDVGGAGQYVTVTIEGARFQTMDESNDVAVRLARPGFEEVVPLQWRVFSATKIMATFDFSGVPYGLYDLTVTNAGAAGQAGETVTIPYRFLVEPMIEPDVTIGIGGPRTILAGESETYSVALGNLANIDAPYTFFQIGIPEMGYNTPDFSAGKIWGVYDLPYAVLTNNVRGGPEEGALSTQNIPWPELESSINFEGMNIISGYAYNIPADGFTGFSFNISTYPLLEAFVNLDWPNLVQYLYELYPEHAMAETLAEGPSALNEIVPGYFEMWLTAQSGMLPEPWVLPEIPFQTNVFATATSLTRDEFIDRITNEAERLRQGVLQSSDVTPGLLNLAADPELWTGMYITSMEEAGVLQPEDVPPQIREYPQIVSQMSILAGGVLSGPAGEEYMRMQDYAAFFDVIRELYGYGELLDDEIDAASPFSWLEAYGKTTDHLAEIDYRMGNGNPVPVMPQFEDYDLGLSNTTHFEAFNIYVPWVGFADRDTLEPGWEENAVFWLQDEQEFQKADFEEYLRVQAENSGLVHLAGPTVTETNGFVPLATSLPYSIEFMNDSSASRHVAEVRIVTELDDALDSVLFRLGDMQIGDIAIDVPENVGMFQREFDFTATRGFLLRVSAGVDIESGIVTWLFQAIDPETRVLIQNPAIGLLPPNNANGDGAGFVSYTVQARPDIAVTGTEINSQARIFFDGMAPQETSLHTVPVDAVPPTTTFTAALMTSESSGDADQSQWEDNSVFHEIKWSAEDDALGSGFHHVTVYVSTDGGIYRIWQRQEATSSGTLVHEGIEGHDYEFLVLATDNAGNQEKPIFLTAGSDDFHPDLGATPDIISSTPDNYGVAPEPVIASTNTLFREAQEGIEAPAATPGLVSEFDVVYEPFTVERFATGFAQSIEDEIGPMAIVEDPRAGHEGEVLISGGAARNEIWRFGFEGGDTADIGAADHWVVLDHPIFNLAFDNDGRLWATTGGGPLLELNPDTGNVLGAYGLLGEQTADHPSGGITMGIAVDPETGLIYVGSGGGIEIFHPEAIGQPGAALFEHYSADENLRVASLAFYQFEDAEGNRSIPELWATTWPDRSMVVRFNGFKRAETMIRFDTEIDSLSFGLPGSALQNLLFVSHNSGDAPQNAEEESWNGTSELTIVDAVTLRRTTLARGGSRGDVVQTTAAGRVLLSQSGQVDVISPAIVPVVSYVNPPDESIVALPMPSIAITFDQWMATGDGTEPESVLNPANYTLTGASHGPVAIDTISYDSGTHTVYLATGGITEPDEWTLTVSSNIESLLGLELQEDLVTTFTTISDFTSLVDIDFLNQRIDHSDRTQSFDVVVTNLATYDFQTPLYLVMDPNTAGSAVTPRDAIGPFTDGRYMIDLAPQLAVADTLKAGTSTEPLTVTIDIPNFARADFTFSLFTAPTENQAPVFDDDPILTSASVGSLYQSSIGAHDPDGTALNFFLADGPEGMWLDPDTKMLQWQVAPGADDAVDATLYLLDDRGGRATMTRTITVDGGNHAPQLPPIDSQIVRRAGDRIELTLEATDADGDTLICWAENLPGGAQFDFDTHTFRWDVGALQSGVYPDVTFYVSDGMRQSVLTTELVILASDQGPTLERPAGRSVLEGETLRFYLDGGDPDGDPVTFTSDSLPAGATLHPTSGLFEWRTGYAQAGEHEITFKVANRGGEATRTTTFNVIPDNGAPQFDLIQSWQAYEEEEIFFQVFALDPDNPTYVPQFRKDDGTLSEPETTEATLVYSIETLPDGASFDTETGEFRWTPTDGDLGYRELSFTATELGDNAKSSSMTVPIYVANLNHRPEIAPIGNVFISLDGPLAPVSIDVSAGDEDGNPLVLRAENGYPYYDLPAFVSFVDNGDGTGVFTFDPAVAAPGDHPIKLVAQDDGDGEGDPEVYALSFDYTFIVSIESDNFAPTLRSEPDRVAVVDRTIEIPIRAADFEQGDLQFDLAIDTADLSTVPELIDDGIYGQRTLRWKPTVDDLGTHQITVTVTDDGTGYLNLVRQSTIGFTLTVLETNAAPTLEAIGDRTIAEAETLVIDFSALASDLDGHTLTYDIDADSMPDGAELDRASGLFTWTPRQNQAGTYDEIVVRAGDGIDEAIRKFSIEVTDTNRGPRIVPIPLQYGREGHLVQFTVVGGDPDDYDKLTWSVTSSDLPADAYYLDTAKGLFRFTPDYDDQGLHTIQFQLEDESGATDTLDVRLYIADTNRAPELKNSNHQVRLGQTLSFAVNASDQDTGTTLRYTATGLPDGATLDEDTGLFEWTPTTGQLGEHVLRLHVSDGQTTTSESILLNVTTSLILPGVTIVRSPGWAVEPGTPVVLQVMANGYAEIDPDSVKLFVDGEEVALDEDGLATVNASGAVDKMRLSAEATDLDGLVGTAEAVIEVLNPYDAAAPQLVLQSLERGGLITQVTDLLGSVLDTNLDRWQLEIARLGSDRFVMLAEGESALDAESLYSLDPSDFPAGFYQLRLSAIDIGNRTNAVETTVEIAAADTSGSYRQVSSDLTVELGEQEFAIQRVYDEAARALSGSTGYGWQLGVRDVDLQLDLAATGRELYGVYAPLRDGTAIYLSTPEGDRLRFEFAPEVVFESPGVRYYRPAWQACDSETGYMLDSVDQLLIRSGRSYYAVLSGRPYHPASPAFEGGDYRLTAPDGTQWQIDSNLGITQQITSSGERLYVSSSGLIGEDGRYVDFDWSESGRLLAMRIDEGETVGYEYDALGNLIRVTHQEAGETSASALHRYGYDPADPHRLQVVTSPGTSRAILIDDQGAPRQEALVGNLGNVAESAGQIYNSTIPSVGAADLFALDVTEEQLQSVVSGKLWIRVQLAGTDDSFRPTVPLIHGAERIYPPTDLIQDDAHQVTALFEVTDPGSYLLEIGAAVAGDYQVELRTAGDVNADGRVDGFDSKLFHDAIASGYSAAADLNGDLVIDTADYDVLMHNYGFLGSQELGYWPGDSDAAVGTTAAVQSAAAAAALSLPAAVAFVPPAPQSSAAPPVLTTAIANGNFNELDPRAETFGWRLGGDTTFDQGTLILAEHEEYVTSMSQTFIVPEDVNSLRFELFGGVLNRLDAMPPESLQVSLLNAADQSPYFSDMSGYDGTGAVLCIRSGGVARHGRTSLTGYSAAVPLGTADEPLTVVIGLNGVAAGTELAVHFDLLAYGSPDSFAVIDNVAVVSNAIPPVAEGESVTIDEDQPIVLDVLANDSDADGTVDRNSIRIKRQPLHGTVVIDVEAGLVEYQPDYGYSGQDSFQYVVRDETGVTSNRATVSITVDPVADTPILQVNSVAGTVNSPILLDIDSSAADPDGSETLLIRISGVPAGAFLNHGTQVQSGVYQLVPEELDGLTITPPTDSTETIVLHVTATAEEAATGEQRTSAASLSVIVSPVLADPVLIESVTINDGEEQRSSVHTLAIGFNQDVDFFHGVHKDVQLISSSDELFALTEDDYSYDAESFTLTIDTSGIELEDGHYALRFQIDGVRGTADPGSRLEDTDATADDGYLTLEYHQLLADFAGGDYVDRADYDSFLEHYPSRKGDERFDPIFDLNDDDRIDSIDYGIWKTAQGKTSDQKAPAVMVGLELDSGLSATDGFTNNATVVGILSDTSAIGELLVSLDGGEAVSAIDQLGEHDNPDYTVPETFFQFTMDEMAALFGGVIADGEHTLTLTAADVHYNTSQPVELTFTLDTTPPAAAPQAPDLLGDSDTGTSDTDDLTSNVMPTFRVTSAEGTTVRLYSGQSRLAEAALDGGTADLSGMNLGFVDETLLITATCVDLAGNESPHSVALTVDLDVTPPRRPTLNLPEEFDTHEMFGDELGDRQTMIEVVTLAGTTEPGAVVTLLDSGLDPVVADAATGGFSFEDLTLVLGDNPFAVEAVDAAGNVVQFATSIRRIGPEITPPEVQIFRLQTDAGLDPHDHVTTSAVVVGKVYEENELSVLKIGIDQEPNIDILGWLDANDEFTLTVERWQEITGHLPQDGEHTVRLFAEDNYLNGILHELNFTLDTTDPATPVEISLYADDLVTHDTGPNPSDNITGMAIFSIVTDAESGSIIRLLRTHDGQLVATERTATSDSETFEIGNELEPLPDGTYEFQSELIDQAGNTVQSEVLSVTVDTTAPLTPNFVFEGAGSDGRTDKDHLAVVGQTDPEILVELYRYGNLTTPIAVVQSDADGSYRFDPVHLSLGDNPFKVIARDWGGNTTTRAGAVYSIADDISPPVLTAALLNDNGHFDDDGVTNDVTVAGTVTDASYVVGLYVSVDGAAPVNMIGLVDEGAFTLTPQDLAIANGSPLQDGEHRIGLSAEDEKGYVCDVLFIDVLLDTVRPSRPTTPDLETADDSGTGSYDHVTFVSHSHFTLFAEPGVRLHLYANGQEIAVDELVDGPVELDWLPCRARQRDAAASGETRSTRFFPKDPKGAVAEEERARNPNILIPIPSDNPPPRLPKEFPMRWEFGEPTSREGSSEAPPPPPRATKESSTRRERLHPTSHKSVSPAGQSGVVMAGQAGNRVARGSPDAAKGQRPRPRSNAPALAPPSLCALTRRRDPSADSWSGQAARYA